MKIYNDRARHNGTKDTPVLYRGMNPGITCSQGGNDALTPKFVLVGVDRSSDNLLSSAYPQIQALCSKVFNGPVDKYGQYLIAGQMGTFRFHSAVVRMTRFFAVSSATITLSIDADQYNKSCGGLNTLQYDDLKEATKIDLSNVKLKTDSSASIKTQTATSTTTLPPFLYTLYPDLEVRIFGGYSKDKYVESTDWMEDNWQSTDSELAPIFWGVIDTISVSIQSTNIFISLNLRDNIRYFVDTNLVQEILPSKNNTAGNSLTRFEVLSSVILNTFYRSSDARLISSSIDTNNPDAIINPIGFNLTDPETRRKAVGATAKDGGTLSGNAPVFTKEQTPERIPQYTFTALPRPVYLQPAVAFVSGSGGNLIQCATLPTDPEVKKALTDNNTKTRGELLTLAISNSTQADTTNIKKLAAFKAAFLSNIYLAKNSVLQTPSLDLLSTGNATGSYSQESQISAAKGITNNNGDTFQDVFTKANSDTTRYSTETLQTIFTNGITAFDSLKDKTYTSALNKKPPSNFGSGTLTKADLIAYILDTKSVDLQQNTQSLSDTVQTYTYLNEGSAPPPNIDTVAQTMGNYIVTKGFAQLSMVDPDDVKNYFQYQALGDPYRLDKIGLPPFAFIYTQRSYISGDSATPNLFKVTNKAPIDVLKHLGTTEAVPTEFFFDHRTGHYFYIPKASAFDFNISNDVKQYLNNSSQLSTLGGLITSTNETLASTTADSTTQDDEVTAAQATITEANKQGFAITGKDGKTIYKIRPITTNDLTYFSQVATPVDRLPNKDPSTIYYTNGGGFLEPNRNIQRIKSDPTGNNYDAFILDPAAKVTDTLYEQTTDGSKKPLGSVLSVLRTSPFTHFTLTPTDKNNPIVQQLKDATDIVNKAATNKTQANQTISKLNKQVSDYKAQQDTITKQQEALLAANPDLAKTLTAPADAIPRHYYAVLEDTQIKDLRDPSGKSSVIIPKSVSNCKVEWSSFGMKTDIHMTNQKGINNGTLQGVGLHAGIIIDERAGIPNYAIPPRNVFIFDETADENMTNENFAVVMAMARLWGRDTKVALITIPGDPGVIIGETVKLYKTILNTNNILQLSAEANKSVNDQNARLHASGCNLGQGVTNADSKNQLTTVVYQADVQGLFVNLSDSHKDPYTTTEEGYTYRIEAVSHIYRPNTDVGFETQLSLIEVI